jgi:dethiobiotin synthetase/adenosylmethionine--8-amino-7-oxononanoate aminotransferase
MSLLFKHLRIHQVFGANTDVGKTVLTCALARASAIKDNAVFYLKPVSTGSVDASDPKSGFFVNFLPQD